MEELRHHQHVAHVDHPLVAVEEGAGGEELAADRLRPDVGTAEEAGADVGGHPEDGEPCARQPVERRAPAGEDLVVGSCGGPAFAPAPLHTIDAALQPLLLAGPARDRVDAASGRAQEPLQSRARVVHRS